MDRSVFSNTVRDQVFARDGNRCVFCGTQEPLQLAHLIPFSSGGEHSFDNLLTICPNCHGKLDSGQVRGFEFEEFVASLLRQSPTFSGVSRASGTPGSKCRFDIVASRNDEKLLIECRPNFAFVGQRFSEIVAQLEKYELKAPNCKVVLATLGELTSEQNQLLLKHGYEHWGPSYFADNFVTELKTVSNRFLATLVGFGAGTKAYETGMASFRMRLLACEPGQADWPVYQRLVGDVLEAFFVPPLEKTIVECSDEYKVNRRDFVLPNYCTEGFWEFLRQQYTADYVVVDAKNYAAPIKKKEVLQISNYLKKHGTGLFAMIFCRKGADASARITLREQWAIYGKLVVVLSDEDVLAMVAASAGGGNPDTIIRQCIEDFRLKM